MPIPLLATAGVTTAGKVIRGAVKVGKAIGGFVGKLFGGGKRKKRRAAAKAAKQSVKYQQQIDAQQAKIDALESKQGGAQNLLASIFGGMPSVTPGDQQVGGAASGVFQQARGLEVIDATDYDSDPARFGFMNRIDQQKRRSMMTYILIGAGAFLLMILFLLFNRNRRR